jgi:hypothetical protein
MAPKQPLLAPVDHATVLDGHADIYILRVLEDDKVCFPAKVEPLSVTQIEIVSGADCGQPQSPREGQAGSHEPAHKQIKMAALEEIADRQIVRAERKLWEIAFLYQGK